MGTPLASREAQVEAVLERLAEAYPDATISLDFSNRRELLVAVVLSGQCTDERVNKVTPSLFDQYPTAAAFAEADLDELDEAIESINYHRQKAEWLKRAFQTIVEEHDGEVPDTMEDLTALTGVGRKTANVVLQHGHDIVAGIVVDTHVQRLSRRLGITTAETPTEIERDLMPVVPESHWRQYTHLLISHGRTTCTARNPDCADCVLADICPSSQLDGGRDLASGEPWD